MTSRYSGWCRRVNRAMLCCSGVAYAGGLKGGSTSAEAAPPLTCSSLSNGIVPACACNQGSWLGGALARAG